MDALFNAQEAPNVIKFMVGSVSATLVKCQGQDRSGKDIVYWMGTVSSEDGSVGKYPLRITNTGKFVGSAALNFIARGGWDKTKTKPRQRAKDDTREKFVQRFLDSVFSYKQGPAVSEEDTSQNVSALLENISGLAVEPGTITEEDESTLGHIGTPSYLVQVARSYNLRFITDIKTYLERQVYSTFAQMVPGAWTDESNEIAATAALSAGQVYLLRKNGLCFKRTSAKAM